MPLRNNIDELPLFFEAAERGDFETVKHYVDQKKTPPQISNDNRETAAHLAAKHGYLDIVRFMVEKEPNILYDMDMLGYSVFFRAVEKGALDIVKYLVEEREQKVCQRHRSNLNSTSLNTAIEFYHFDMLRYFIDDKHADVNYHNNFRQPPVFSAVEFQRRDMFMYLAEEKNANLSLIDYYQENILYTMVNKDDLSLMKYVLDERKIEFDLDQRNRLGDTLVLRASLLNRLNILEYLVGEKGASVHVREIQNMTALHCAAFKNNYEVCKYLVDHGADPRAMDNFGKIPVQKATDKGLIEYLNSTSDETQRNRRSLLSPLVEISALHSSRELVARVDSGRVTSFGDISGFYENTVSSCSTLFYSWLALTSTIIGNVRRDRPSIFLSSTERRIDPLAVESVNNYRYARRRES